MMLSTFALAIALGSSPAPAIEPTPLPITRHIEGSRFVTEDASRLEIAQPGTRDTLDNGAKVGAIIGGIVTGVAIGYLCGTFRDDGGSCWPPVVLWTAIGAGAGALAGAGIDALFERRVGVRWTVRF